MKKEPCIRLGIRIRPKISEKPAERRNSRPPRAMLFTARVSQRLIDNDPAAYCRPPGAAHHARATTPDPCRFLDPRSAVQLPAPPPGHDPYCSRFFAGG